MPLYEIRFSKKSSKTLHLLDAKLAVKTANSIGKLASESKPPGFRKITGSDNYYRIRVGGYRVVYQIRSSVVMIYGIRTGHRKDILPLI